MRADTRPVARLHLLFLAHVPTSHILPLTHCGLMWSLSLTYTLALSPTGNLFLSLRSLSLYISLVLSVTRYPSHALVASLFPVVSLSMTHSLSLSLVLTPLTLVRRSFNLPASLSLSPSHSFPLVLSNSVSLTRPWVNVSFYYSHSHALSPSPSHETPAPSPTGLVLSDSALAATHSFSLSLIVSLSHSYVVYPVHVLIRTPHDLYSMQSVQ